ncbi:MAG: SGNH/GDSL hydrolase family protein [Acidimicrobiales bacterium]|jgi:lysophospholipase L1-like esterase
MLKFGKIPMIISGAMATMLLIAFAPATQASAGAAISPPYYLALGDSLAYGYHSAQFASEYPNIVPASFNAGYVNDFGAALQFFNRHLQIINDGCPGETTDSFINGSGVTGYCAGGPTGTPFPYVWLHHPYAAGSQLADALAILGANKNATAITLDIGSNDVLQFIEHTCGFPATYTCTTGQVGAEFVHIVTNVGSILGQLHAAAPHTKIVLLGLYNPYPIVLPAPGGDYSVAQLNTALADVIAAVPNASFANPEPEFNPAGYKGKPETGDIPAICLLTGMCPGGTYDPASPNADIHPTNLGYGVLATLIGLDYLTH